MIYVLICFTFCRPVMSLGSRINMLRSLLTYGSSRTSVWTDSMNVQLNLSLRYIIGTGLVVCCNKSNEMFAVFTEQ